MVLARFLGVVILSWLVLSMVLANEPTPSPTLHPSLSIQNTSSPSIAPTLGNPVIVFLTYHNTRVCWGSWEETTRLSLPSRLAFTRTLFFPNPALHAQWVLQSGQHQRIRPLLLVRRIIVANWKPKNINCLRHFNSINQRLNQRTRSRRLPFFALRFASGILILYPVDSCIPLLCLIPSKPPLPFSHHSEVTCTTSPVIVSHPPKHLLPHPSSVH